MSRVVYRERAASRRTLRQLNEAVCQLELALDGILLAVVLLDRHGLFIELRPEAEADIARSLAQIDLNALLRVVEEHAP